MSLAHPVRSIVLLGAAAAIAFVASDAGATSRAAKPACGPRAASRGPTFVFGREGGNIRPASTALYADGRVTRGADSADSSATVSPDAVAGLARLAHVGGFWTVQVPATRRPPRNPDVARQYVEVHLTCGSHRVETAGDVPARMRELLALLEAVAPLRP